MLPLNVQGNPTTIERDRAYAAMNRDISWHAQQAINDADFMKAVRSIRERKERERAALGVTSGRDSTVDHPR
jgi:thiamine pyrophosphokinase